MTSAASHTANTGILHNLCCDADINNGETFRKGESIAKIGRYAPCPCGSGEKYKKCCLRKDKEACDDLEEDEDEVGWGETEDSWPSDEESEVPGTDYLGAEEVFYPQIDNSIPAISESEQAIVDEWWEGFSPIYRDRDADEMIRRIVGFMEEHPNLFVHLYLDEECLFELGAELARRGEHSRHAELLQRIRKEHPEVFIRSHGYYDRDIITELILNGQREEISQHFNFFKEYPDSHPDELSCLPRMQDPRCFPLSRIINGQFDPEGKNSPKGCNASFLISNRECSRRKRRGVIWMVERGMICL